MWNINDSIITHTTGCIKDSPRLMNLQTLGGWIEVGEWKESLETENSNCVEPEGRPKWEAFLGGEVRYLKHLYVCSLRWWGKNNCSPTYQLSKVQGSLSAGWIEPWCYPFFGHLAEKKCIQVHSKSVYPWDKWCYETNCVQVVCAPPTS